MSNDIRVTLSGNSTPLLPSEPIRATERMFPLQRPRSAKSAPHPLQIPWSVAEKAYCEYARQYGRGQSLERLAERGGFDGAEMDELYPPWRDEVSELTSLRARLAEAESEITDIMRTLGVVGDWKEPGVGPGTMALAVKHGWKQRESDLEQRLAEAEARAGRAEEAVKKCRRLVDACYTEFVGKVCLNEPDDEPVMKGGDGDWSPITFGMIYAARAAVEGAQ